MIDPNVALTVYLGSDRGVGYVPMNQTERMQSHFQDQYQAAMDLIQKYLDYDFLVDWGKHDLKSASELFRKQVVEAFPELVPRVAQSLSCRFTYGWR